MKKLIARVKAEESTFGKHLIRWVGYIGGAAALIGQAIEITHAFPEEYLPSWLPRTIGLCAVIGFVIGKLTKKK